MFFFQTKNSVLKEKQKEHMYFIVKKSKQKLCLIIVNFSLRMKK